MARAITCVLTACLAMAAMACADSDRSEVLRSRAGRVSEATSESRAGAAEDRAGRPPPAIVFLGTSLTAGYGLEVQQAYPGRVQQKIDSLGLDYRVVNAGVSGETSAGGLGRIGWILDQPVAVLVLELGANDALRGQSPDALRANLQEIIDRTRAAHPDARIVIAGMRAPPNLGRRYAQQFERVFTEIAEKNGAALIPSLLEGVAADPGLNQPDGIHPTAEGHRIIAENVWQVLRPILERVSGPGSDGTARFRGSEEQAGRRMDDQRYRATRPRARGRGSVLGHHVHRRHAVTDLRRNRRSSRSTTPRRSDLPGPYGIRNACERAQDGQMQHERFLAFFDPGIGI